MRWPWVSRLRLELAEERLVDREQRIDDLLKVNDELIDLNRQLRSMPAQSPQDEQPIEPPKPHRKLGAQIREEFRRGANERAEKAKSGVK
jgi:hypothetical protein